MKTNKEGSACNEMPNTGIPHVRFAEEKVASAPSPRRGFLLFKGAILSMRWLVTFATAALAFSAVADSKEYVITVGADGAAATLALDVHTTVSNPDNVWYASFAYNAFSQQWIKDIKVYAYYPAINGPSYYTEWRSLLNSNGSRLNGIELNAFEMYGNPIKIEVSCAENTTGQKREYRTKLNSKGDYLTICQSVTPNFEVKQPSGGASIKIGKSGGDATIIIKNNTSKKFVATISNYDTSGTAYMTRKSGSETFSPNAEQIFVYAVPSLPSGMTSRTGYISFQNTSVGMDIRICVSQSDTASAPKNDNFSAPTKIAGEAGSINDSNVGATMEPFEPKPSASSKATGSVWYTWTAPASGMVTLTASGVGFDPIIGVYTGMSIYLLPEVDSNYHVDEYKNSKLTFSAVSGETYRIAVYGDNWGTGIFALIWRLSVPQSVIFNPNGGSCSVSTATYTIGGTYASPSLPPATMTGYTFAGWWTDSSGGTQITASSIVSSSTSRTLYAHWTANTYSVKLDSQGGSGGTSSVTATYGSAMPPITIPKLSGYDFGGYYTGINGSGTQYYTASGASAKAWDKTSATTLYAKWISTVPLATALDSTSLAFSTGGSANWLGVTDESYSGGSSAKSGVITHSQSTWMQTEVSGEGTLSFWYKVSSESSCDKLMFYIDGISRLTKSGTSITTWQQFTCDITNNTQHVFKWTYSKDSSVSKGSDCCWIDKVEWTPTYKVTYMPGSNVSGLTYTATKTNDIALVLRGSTYTRTDYTQTGWATSDGGAKVYDLEARYTANATATLYPFWTANAYTSTTEVPVPYAWLLTHGTVAGGDYEAVANATAANGRKVWTCYALGLDPADPSDDFHITKFWMDGDKPMFEYSHTANGSGKSFEEYINKLGKAKLTDKWRLVPSDGSTDFRFFTVEVVFPGGTSIADSHDKVQLWEGGPYWATKNIGAEKPEDYGYYFWWGDTVGYKREGGAWVASDGSSSNFSFGNSPSTSTLNKSISTLQSEGWVVQENDTYILTPEHDAAQVQWGGGWRMPTNQELSSLNNNCDWTWTTQNGVNGYIVRGRGAYASNSIFLPSCGEGYGTSLYSSGSIGYYWSSVLYSGTSSAYGLYFNSGSRYADDYYGRRSGQSVRPVQGLTK